MVDLFRCFHSKIEKHEKCLTGRRKWKPLAYSNTSCWLNESFSEKLDGLHQFVDTGIELLNQKENFFNHLMYSFTFNFLKAKKFFLQFLRFKDSFYLNIVDPISSTIILKILDKIWLVQVVFPNSRLLFRLITPIFLKRRKHYMATIFKRWMYGLVWVAYHIQYIELIFLQHKVLKSIVMMVGMKTKENCLFYF